MKLARFEQGGRVRLGVVAGEEMVDLAAAAPHLPQDMLALLRAGPEALETAGRVAAEAPAAARMSLASVRLLAPVPRPGKILGIGLNYGDHARETGREPPQHQMWFVKAASCVIGPGETILKPAVSERVDFEAELVVVIGRFGRHVPAARAHEIVAGYMAGNDVSARDWQNRTPQFTLGKGFDTHGPTGPWIVTPDELGDPHRLAIRCVLNGQTMQDGTTADMLFPVWDQIAELTKVFPLEPGDLLFTGTPAGVGVARTPPVFLQAGDVVRIEIEGIGALENPVADEIVKTVIG